MKKIFKYSMLFAAALTLSLGFASCSDDNDEPETPSSVNPDLNGTDQIVGEACNNWREARQDWEWSEAFLFGPATDFGLDPHTDTWPFDRVQFDKYMKKYNPATDEDDAALIDDAIANGQNLTGFHAVEYLIFRDGDPRKIKDMTANEVYFAQSAAKDLYLSSLKLVTAWGGELTEAEQKIIDDAEFESKNYGEDFMTAGEPGSKYSSITLATREIIAGANEIIGEVRDSKIGAPATGEDVNYIESPFARNSIVDFYDNIMSCKHALYGGWNVVDQPTATSLLGVCLKVNNADMKAAAQKAQTKLNAALNKIDNMKKPFVLYYTDQSAKDAMAALDELESALDALDGEIEKFSGNATLEAEFKKVNEAFVKNTVIPTYRALADNDLKLLNSLKKITWKK